MRSQSGQAILGLILVMVIALGIGLSVVQRSLVDISSSSKVEESSRAFSAAEAGIEKALKGDTTAVNFAENRSSATIYDTGLLPCVPGAGACPPGRQAALEYPPLAKEEVAHFWLADFTSASNPPTIFYNPPAPRTLDVYWGEPGAERAALEITLVSYSSGQYLSRKWYLDSIIRTPPNNFDQVSTCAGTYLSNNYQCRETIGDGSPALDTPLPAGLMLLRTRLLYNSTSSQPVAIQAVGTCGSSCSIPPQGKFLTSVGISGETERRIRVFQIEQVVPPPYFDFAIFSMGDISK